MLLMGGVGLSIRRVCNVAKVRAGGGGVWLGSSYCSARNRNKD
jgi:hypothetical protein